MRHRHRGLSTRAQRPRTGRWTPTQWPFGARHHLPLPTGSRPGRGRWAPPCSLVEHGWLYLYLYHVFYWYAYAMCACVAIDACKLCGTCHKDALCITTNDSHICQCRLAYTGDGYNNCTKCKRFILRPLGRILRRTLSVRPSRYRCHG